MGAFLKRRYASAMRTFRHEQRRVAVGMAAALSVSVAAVTVALLLDGGEPVGFEDRLASALQIAIVPLAWIAASIGSVARLRFLSERDISGSAAADPSPKVRLAIARLQNTFEQGVLAIGAYLALAATLPRSTTLVATLAVLFSLGRILFWIGHEHGAAGRAFGFALTFSPTIGALVVALGTIAIGAAA